MILVGKTQHNTHTGQSLGHNNKVHQINLSCIGCRIQNLQISMFNFYSTKRKIQPPARLIWVFLRMFLSFNHSSNFIYTTITIMNSIILLSQVKISRESGSFLFFNYHLKFFPLLLLDLDQHVY